MLGFDVEAHCQLLGWSGFREDPLIAQAQWAIRVVFIPVDTPEYGITCWYAEPEVILTMSVANRRILPAGHQPVVNSLMGGGVAAQRVSLSLFRCGPLLEILKQSHLQSDFLGGDAATGAVTGAAATPGTRISRDPRVTTEAGTNAEGAPRASAVRRAALEGTHTYGLIQVQKKLTQWETTYAKAWFPHDAENVLLDLARECFKSPPFAQTIPRERPVPWTPSRRMKAVE